MTQMLQDLLTDPAAVLAAVRSRRKGYVEKTITGSTQEVLVQKAALEETEGWTLLRKNKSSFRLKRDKPLDEQLEDSVWVTLAKMGFDELSDGRGFTVDLGDGNSPRQIDVLAKDRECVVIVECTTCSAPKTKSMRELIDKVTALQKPVADAIREHYGREPKLKVKWAIATMNVQWGDADLQRAVSAGVVVLRESVVGYYAKLTSHLKVAAKYQFLSHLFADESIHALGIPVPATKGRMGTRTFYNFLIRPAELLKIAYVSHKASRDTDDLETYQRMLQPKRLRDIAAYIDGGGQFPTNIVINIKSKRGLRFDSKEQVGDSAFGTLYLPNRYACCWIIDGQHRLYGYAHSERAKKRDDKTVFPVLAYDNLPATEEAKLFVDVNCEQVRVTKRLLNELYANLRWDSHDFKERVDALCARVVIALNVGTSSPFCDRIIVSNKDKSNRRCLTMTSFTDGLRNERLFGREGKLGPLMDSTAPEASRLEAARLKATEVLLDYFCAFRDAMPDQWELGDAKGGYICTNNAVRSLLMVLREILDHIAVRQSVDVDMLSRADLGPEVSRLSLPIIQLLATADPQQTDEFRSRQALKGVRKNALMMMSCIHRNIPEFLPNCLSEYLASVDEEGTGEAREMIDDIQKRLFGFVVTRLKEEFRNSPEAWWYQGMPEKVRKACRDRCEEEKGVKRPEQYLCLVNYRDIALHSWPIFERLFSLGQKGSKTKVTEWVVELSNIRNITHHREKWPAEREQVERVRQIHSLVVGTMASIEGSPEDGGTGVSVGR